MNHVKNISIPKGIEIDNINLRKSKISLFTCQKLSANILSTGKDISLNSGRFGPYLKCENKSARLRKCGRFILQLALIVLSAMIAEAKPGRISSSIIKDLGEHPED